ncbi:MAG: Y-family DNA polymerase, partial [bacterium]
MTDTRCLFALVDCNNFYASCERVFKPELRGQPIVVLSNNDGCIIARSDEAKQLGIPMAAPLFEHRDKIEQHDIHVFSSNYPLYGDMSQRVIDVLERFTPNYEVYSIDEVFLEFSNLSDRDFSSYAREIRRVVKDETGIPVSIGLGPTKTLAKVASERAKPREGGEGVFLCSKNRVSEVLSDLPVEDIWGIGDRRGETCRRDGIETALELREAPDPWLRENLSVEGLRTAWELGGISCIPLENAPDPKKNIACSRTFGERLIDKEPILSAVSDYATR